MSTDDGYNGWTNRETWAVALHINNDQGWQESVLEAVREVVQATDEPYGDSDTANFRSPAAWAGDVIRENVESQLDPDSVGWDAPSFVEMALPILTDIGSLWRVNWTELGAAFLSDLDELDEDKRLIRKYDGPNNGVPRPRRPLCDCGTFHDLDES